MPAYIVTVFFMMLCVAAGTAWPPWLRVWGQAPDLALVAVMSIGLTRGANLALWAGFFGALFTAGATPAPMPGLFVTHMGIGVVFGSLRGRLFSDRLILAMLLTVIGVFAAGVFMLLLWPPESFEHWSRLTLVRALYSGLAAMILYPVIRFLAGLHGDPLEREL